MDRKWAGLFSWPMASMKQGEIYPRVAVTISCTTWLFIWVKETAEQTTGLSRRKMWGKASLGEGWKFPHHFHTMIMHEHHWIAENKVNTTVKTGLRAVACCFPLVAKGLLCQQPGSRWQGTSYWDVGLPACNPCSRSCLLIHSECNSSVPRHYRGTDFKFPQA